MFILENFNVLFQIFHLVGLAPISAIGQRSNTNRFAYLTSVILCSTSSIIIVTFLLLFPHLTSHGPIHSIIDMVHSLSSLLMILTAIGQCYYRKSTYMIIIHRTQKMEECFRKKVYAKFPVQCACRYRLKVLLILTLYFVTQVLVFIESWLGDGSLISSFLISFIRIIHPLVVLHLVLYIDVATMFLQELNQHIRNSSIFFHSSKLDLLKNIKLIHMNLWKLVKQINVFFGTNLPFLIINSFMYTTHQFYWIFLTAYAKWNLLGIIGRCS